MTSRMSGGRPRAAARSRARVCESARRLPAIAAMVTLIVASTEHNFTLCVFLNYTWRELLSSGNFTERELSEEGAGDQDDQRAAERPQPPQPRRAARCHPRAHHRGR